MAKKKKSKKEKQSVAVNKDAAISRFRNRIMSDETVKYIYSEKESILHDYETVSKVCIACIYQFGGQRQSEYIHVFEII